MGDHKAEICQGRQEGVSTISESESRGRSPPSSSNDCVSDISQKPGTSLQDESHTKSNSVEVSPKSTKQGQCEGTTVNDKDILTLKNTKSLLEKDVKEKEEKLRKLQMVKMYRSKNDLQELTRLIDKWHEVTKLALEELLEMSQNESNCSMEQLISHLGIDPTMLPINTDEPSSQ